jgi:hypothetical protein
MCAMRAAALLGATRLPIDRVNGPHFEVYPGAAPIRWDLADTRVALVAEIERRCPWLALGASDRVELARTEHAVDALPSSPVARAAAEKKTVRPPDGIDSDVLAREAWFHLPVADSLATLAV